MSGMSCRGTGTNKKIWMGKWYKPWTWFKFGYVIEDFNLISIDMVDDPPPGCEFNFDIDIIDQEQYH